MFQDLGASGAGAGRNIDLRPHNITEKAFRTNQGKKFLGRGSSGLYGLCNE